MKKHRISLLAASLASLLASFTLILSPYFLGLAIDSMLGQGQVDFEGVSYYLTLTLVVYVLSFSFTSLSSLIANRVSVAIVSDLRTKVHNHLNKLPLSYLEGDAKGLLGNLFASDGELLLDGLYQFLTQFLAGVFLVFIALFFMFSISPLMTGIVLALLPLVFLTSWLVSRSSMKLFSQQQVLSSELRETVSEMVDHHELVLTYSYHDEIRSDFSELNKRLVAVAEKAQFVSAITNPTTRVVNNITYLLMGLSGAYVVANYGLSVGFLTSFISYAALFAKPFNELSSVVAQISAGQASYNRFLEVLSVKEEASGPDVSLEGNRLEFESVDFSYQKGRPTIQDLNLNIAPLSKVAIVGPTGSGKSTLINLLMRFVDADSGSIKIDGKDVSSMSRSSVRKVMGIVLQDPWLFEGSIFDNIAYGKEGSTLDEVYEASRLAGCYDFIMSLDKGFDTYVSASNISLGHKQMITIARCLIAQAPILILDEATSSIDSLSEKHIQEVFSKIMASHTSFFVAHRLSSVIDSDLILVMKEGQLIERGTHDQLMALQGFYHDLFMSQF